MAEDRWVSPSLNRAILADLPGLPPELRGARAFDWLAGLGVGRLVSERLTAGGLQPVHAGFGRDAVQAAAGNWHGLARLLAAGDAAAANLVDTIGVALAGLVATLVLAPGDVRATRPDWPPAQWARWAAVRTVGVGGGVMDGLVGRCAMAAAVRELPRLGAADVVLIRPAEPGTLALRAAATGLPDGPAVLLDVGLTAIKVGSTTIEDGACGSLAAVERIEPPSGLRGAAFADLLADLVVAAVPATGLAPGSAGFAIAAYTDHDGQPIVAQDGLYGSLGSVQLCEHLAGRLGRALGGDIAVRVHNDGEAAALAMAGGADAVIMLGTAIGVGMAA